jgi:hypothetical protein
VKVEAQLLPLSATIRSIHRRPCSSDPKPAVREPRSRELAGHPYCWRNLLSWAPQVDRWLELDEFVDLISSVDAKGRSQVTRRRQQEERQRSRSRPIGSLTEEGVIEEIDRVLSNARGHL